MLDLVTQEPLNAETGWDAYADPLTPVSSFFKRNHAPIPHLAQTEYRLHVGTHAVTYAELLAMPQSSSEVTLECAGNGRKQFHPLPSGTPWGMKAVSNGLWEGVSLRSVLDRFPAPEGTVEVVFRAVDRAPEKQGLYARSLTFQEIEETNPILALRMNGQILPAEHGFPVRLVVPGYYGMASVKWVTQIEFVSEPFRGYFQVEDYHIKRPGQIPRPARWMQPKSLIAFPQEGPCDRQVRVGGWAWGGKLPIENLEVELEGPERRTVPAVLGPARGPHAWRSWETTLELPAGSWTLRSFAVDAGGNRQPRTVEWNEDGYENNQAQQVQITVS